MIYKFSPTFWSTIEIVQFLIKVAILLHNLYSIENCIVLYKDAGCVAMTQYVSNRMQNLLKMDVPFSYFFLKFAYNDHELESALSCVF
jgi:hypothetical protein